MKMGKKVREYKSGDFIFAKVKGYPAWPARVQKLNGKKYFVYFYGTGETANLPPNMIFDYAENKDKFLTKTVKRRDFNDGVKQIEYDFANNVPLEQVIGAGTDIQDSNNTMNETSNETADECIADTTADDTIADEHITQNDTPIEDSDDTGTLVIDEGGKQKPGKKGTKTPAKETPKPKEVKTPRRGKKEEVEIKEDDKKDEELVSRSGRKIRPKRYIDEHTEENSTLPSPAPKKRRASPVESEKENAKEKDSIQMFNVISQNELEDLKEPFASEDPEKEAIIITYLPSGQYIGIKLFQSRPSFKNEASRLQWDKQAASNALTLKMQLEKSQITAQSVLAQLVMDLNLSDEEKATFDKERETEEKKSRVQFLKTEMKLIELDAKIKTCLCLEKADTELCLKLLDELMELELKPLMLLKHPSCAETMKRMRAYVGNAPSWDLSDAAVLLFTQHAAHIRTRADALYNHLKELFPTPEGLSFWEFFTERVAQFKKATAKLTSDELLELVHEPLEMSLPTSHTMKSAIEAVNEEAQDSKKNKTPVKSKKAVNSTPSKPPLKRQSSRKQQQDEKEKEKETITEEPKEKSDPTENEENNSSEAKDSTEIDKDSKENGNNNKEKDSTEVQEKDSKDTKTNKDTKDKESKETKEEDSKDKDIAEEISQEENIEEDSQKEKSPANDLDKESKDESLVSDKDNNDKVVKGKNNKEDKSEKNSKEEKEKVEDEPRPKRTRESKKTEPPPRSPTKRKAKMN